jgi:hypothetical protein
MLPRSCLLRSVLSVLVIALGCLTCPGRACADFVVYAGDISTGSSSATGQNISFTYKDGTNTTYTFTNQYAGQLLASFVSAGKVGDFTMYCVDITDSFHVPSNWHVNVNGTGSIDGGMVNNAGQVAYLIDNYGFKKLDADHSAGLQAAIWREIYGTNFTLTSASAGVTSAYTTYLGYVTGSNSGNVATASWLNPTTQTNLGETPQGMVTVPPPGPPGPVVPAPPSIVMAAIALACFAGYSRVRGLGRARSRLVLAQ